MRFNSTPQTTTLLIYLFALISLTLHLIGLNNYGIGRDEFLHIALGNHPAAGYMEVPPFIAWIAKFSITFFGDSAFAIRIIPATFAALTILTAGFIVKEIGGRNFAITINGLALCLSPAFLASGYLLQPVVFDQFWWVLTYFLLIKYTFTRQSKYLLFLGPVIGLGLLTKYAILFVIIAIIAGLLLTAQRKLLVKKQLYMAVFIALLIFLPNIIWQYLHHWPVLTHMKELTATQLVHNTAIGFIKAQLISNGTAVLLWIPGLLLLLFHKKMANLRWMGFSYFLLLALLIYFKGKPYYAFGVYPVLFALSAYGIELVTQRTNTSLKYVIAFLVLLPNAVFMPMFIPILPIDRAVVYFKSLHMDDFLYWEDGKKHQTTQDYGDMFGWEEMTAITAKAYAMIPENQRNSTTIFVENYGEAGAIDHLGKKYKLPPVVSLSSSFTLWAPERIPYQCIIYVDDKGQVEKIKPAYAKAELIGTVTNKLSREYETKIWLLTGAKVDINPVYQSALKEKRQ
ncbi:glycosyltransferase family 39 protein [Pedobacter sp. WC2423]|uniref:glycosyltransferase family 39 protein n=1 Tax=Pedobacter sp. WC2423 TaxID=3234142 RepID=UPI0034656E8E